jgi:hypothetical protein
LEIHEEKMFRTKKPEIGNIYEIKVSSGLAYFQYTHEAEDGTQLIRVLPGIHSGRPNDFSALSHQKELYFIFTVLSHALRKKEIELVSNQPVPEWAKQFPTMRKVAGRARGGKITGWLIGHGLRLYTVQEIQQAQYSQDLTPEQKKLSIASIWAASTLGEKIERNWLPERSEEIEEADRQRAAEREAQAGKIEQPEARFIDHYLYFPKRHNAEQAANQLRAQGWIVELRMGADEKNWLVLAKQPAPIDESIGDIRDKLENLAEEMGGEYDGWGTAV